MLRDEGRKWKRWCRKVMVRMQETQRTKQPSQERETLGKDDAKKRTDAKRCAGRSRKLGGAAAGGTRRRLILVAKDCRSGRRAPQRGFGSESVNLLTHPTPACLSGGGE